MFDYVGETNTIAKFGWNPSARGRSTHTWNIHFLWLPRGRHFRIGSQKIAPGGAAPPGGEIMMTSYPACNKTSLSRKHVSQV